MALSAEQIEILKYVNDSTKSTINGYAREARKTCDLKQEIPSEIIQIILLFYYLAEHFDIHSKDIRILGHHKDVIKKRKKGGSGWNNMAFGAVPIPSMSNNIITWTFKMMENNTTYNNGLVLGIVNCEDINNVSNEKWHYQSQQMISYFYISAKNIYCNGEKIDTKYGEELGNAEAIIKMELNLKRGELIYYKNGKCLGVATKIQQAQNIYIIICSAYSLSSIQLN